MLDKTNGAQHLKKLLLLSPGWILFLLLFIQWVLYYSDSTATYFVFFGVIIFSVICMAVATFQLIRKHVKEGLFVSLPVLLWGAILGFPSNKLYSYSRHYAEFFVQKTFYLPELKHIKAGTTYQAWNIRKNGRNSYFIIYDASDEILKKIRRKLHA